MKYTPGPWKYGGNQSKEIYQRQTGNALCKMIYHSTWPPEWQEANARLIAAAPDLLQACMEARVVLNITPCTCNEDRDCQRCFTLRKINQAIIKVEG